LVDWNIFRPELEIDFKIYVKESMPEHTAYSKVTFNSYWDKLKWWWIVKRGLNKMESSEPIVSDCEEHHEPKIEKI